MGHSRDTLVEDCARGIYEGFLRYNGDFGRITRRAGKNFVTSDWGQAQADLVERMGLWEKSLAHVGTSVREMLGSTPSLHEPSSLPLPDAFSARSAWIP